MVEPKHYRLGDLLLAADILKTDYIKEALSAYESQGLPLGKVLVVSGYLSDDELKSTLDLQYMVNDQLLEFDKAVEVLKLCCSEGLTISEAFHKARIVKPEEKETNKLGSILVDAGVIDDEILEDCLVANESTSLPLGHIISHRGKASQAIIDRALCVQNLARTGKLVRKVGIESLKWALSRENDLLKLDANKGYVKKPFKTTPKTGELFSELNILSESQINELLVNSISQNKTFGMSLRENFNVSKEVVDSVIELQEMIDRKTITKETALKALPNIVAQGHSSTRAVAEASLYGLISNQAPALIELMKSSGVLKVEQISRDITESLTVNYNQARQVAFSLVNGKIASEQIVFSALRLIDLINRKVITFENGIVALEFSNRAKRDVEYTLFMTGVFDRTRLKEEEYPELN